MEPPSRCTACLRRALLSSVRSAAAVGLSQVLTSPETAAMKQWHQVAWLLCSTPGGTPASSQTLCLLLSHTECMFSHAFVVSILMSLSGKLSDSVSASEVCFRGLPQKSH